jgi:hypothetical protein
MPAAPFRMLTDFGNGYAISLNLAIWLGEEMKQYLTGRGRDLAIFHGIDSWIVPIPATFVVVGADGLVKARGERRPSPQRIVTSKPAAIPNSVSGQGTPSRTGFTGRGFSRRGLDLYQNRSPRLMRCSDRLQELSLS